MLVEISNVAVSLDAMLPGNEDALLREVAKAVGVKSKDLSPLPFSSLPSSNPEALSSQSGKFLEDAVLYGERIGLLRRSVDARKKSNVHFVITVLVDLAGLDAEGIDADRALGRLGKRAKKGIGIKPYQAYKRLEIPNLSAFCSSGDFRRPVIVGAGPAGLFAGLYLAQAGMRPIIVERGKPVEQRICDVESFASGGELNTNSNVQFGEGGAGTFSDGKLNTGIKSPYIRHVLREFVAAGAPNEILVNAKPHIGTDLLPGIVRNMRKSIEHMGGTFLFSTQFVGFGASSNKNGGFEEIDGGVGFSDAASSNGSETTAFDMHLDGSEKAGTGIFSSKSPLSIEDVELLDLETDAIERIETDTVVLAIGHSARDTYEMLAENSVSFERKPFAMGVRVEHLQRDVNKAQYGDFVRHPLLGAADYKLAVRDDDGRGVYTFCMCPGGSVVCASSEEEGVCVNGMSTHARDGENANSALLVEVRPDDLPGSDVFAGIALQREVEHLAYQTACKTACQTNYQMAEDRVADKHKAAPKACKVHAAEDEVADECEVVPRAYNANLSEYGKAYECETRKACNAHETGNAHASGNAHTACETYEDDNVHALCETYKAPAQTVRDFMEGGFGTKSRKVTPTYPRGVVWCDLHDVLPPFILDAMHDAIPKLDRKLAGFGDSEAVMTGVEARSSSPVRIIRDRDDLQSVSVAGLYPAGEGAGYAGGIMSAAVDGIRVAEKIVSAFADKRHTNGIFRLSDRDCAQ